MSLDIRIPIGLLFGIIGAILVVYGQWSSDPAIYARSFGLNANVWWGVVLLVFALMMLGLAQHARKSGKKTRPDATPGPLQARPSVPLGRFDSPTQARLLSAASGAPGTAPARCPRRLAPRPRP